MNWTHWIVCERHGIDAYTPLEIGADGAVTVVIGLALMVPQEDIIGRGVKQIIRVDDEWDLSNPRTVYLLETPPEDGLQPSLPVHGEGSVGEAEAMPTEPSPNPQPGESPIPDPGARS